MSDQPAELLYSSNESDLLQLRIGRCNADYFNPESLRDQIVEGNYDVCRLRIACDDESAAEKLDSMGFPYYFSGSIRRYVTPITDRPAGDYIHQGLTFEYYDGSQEKLLFDMIDGTWGDYPIGYYRTPFLNSLITKEMETECLFQFYKRANNPNLNPANNMVFIREGDHYVGFFALNHVDGHLESHVGGILKPYRTGGYFLDMQRYIKNYCLDNGLSAFWFGARNENSRVQTIFQAEGYLPVGTENVYHILPLLNYNPNGFQPEDILLKSENPCQEILHAVLEMAGLTDHYRNRFKSFECFGMTNDRPESVTLHVKGPAISKSDSLYPYLVTDKSGGKLFRGYLRLRRED